MATTENGDATTFQTGNRYRVQLVRGWWLEDKPGRPEWYPVMGSLHEDQEFFGFEWCHYHVDPRFLNAKQGQQAAEEKRQQERGGQLKAWHPSYQKVLTHFALKNDPNCLVINPQRSQVIEGDSGLVTRYESREWGLKQIQTRWTERTCHRQLPQAQVDKNSNRGFKALRKRFANATGDVCPHRGYDLRNVPVEGDGCRQCPLHQLRVRAPGRGEVANQ